MIEDGARTNGFLFADLREYTSFVEAHGDLAAAALLADYRSLVRDAVAQSGGAEIKTEGDSFYVVFPSASSAVRCGLAIVRSAEGHGRDGRRIPVGIGIHAGETVETPEGYVGSAVNVAARVCSQARAGEVLVTETVRALTRTYLPVRFVDRRTRRLKGLAEPIVLYRVEPLEEGEPATGWKVSGRTAALRRPRTALAAGALAALVVVGAVAASILLTGVPGERAGSTDLPPAGSRLPTPSPAPFPDAAEADLIAQVPIDIRDGCGRANEADRIGDVASVACDLELAAEADTVWYDQFATLQGLSTKLAELSERHRLARGQCAPDVPRAQGNWQVGSTHSGRLLCFADDAGVWVGWSYDAERIVARAVREGEGPEAWQGLYGWWEQVRLFLR